MHIHIPTAQKRELYATIASLEKDIASLKREIRERDETIGDKERRIYDLKKKNQVGLRAGWTVDGEWGGC